MNQPRKAPFFAASPVVCGLALACAACASSSAPTPAAGPPVAAATLRADHQAVVDRLTDQANDLCRVSGKEAKIIQVGTTDLTREPESRHIVYECVAPPGTDADEANAAPDDE